MDKHSTRSLHTGNKMPVMGLGTWKLTENTAEIVQYAIDEAGYRLIDTSSDYDTHEGIGKAIQSSEVDRDELFVMTKVEETDEAYSAAEQYVKEELGLDYVDMILIHRPPESGVGIKLWEGLIKAKEENITRGIGVSNYSVEQLKQLIDETGVVPEVNEIEWTPFGHSNEMKEYCDQNDIQIVAYSPLTRGKRLSDDTLQELAEKYDKAPGQIILRWDVQTGIIPIPKSSSEEHISENIDIFDFELDDEDIKRLSELNELYSSFGFLQYM